MQHDGCATMGWSGRWVCVGHDERVVIIKLTREVLAVVVHADGGTALVRRNELDISPASRLRGERWRVALDGRRVHHCCDRASTAEVATDPAFDVQLQTDRRVSPYTCKGEKHAIAYRSQDYLKELDGWKWCGEMRLTCVFERSSISVPPPAGPCDGRMLIVASSSGQSSCTVPST